MAFGQLDEPYLNEIAELIRRQDREFLFARLAVHEMIARPELLSRINHNQLTGLLGSDHRTLFAAAVERLAADSPSARPLLEAPALARGRGIPRGDRVWRVMADAVAENSNVRESDIDHLLQQAAPYVMLDAENGQSVYRLAHRTFQEYFLRNPPRQGSDGRSLERRHRRVARALMKHANTAPEINPYLTHRLAEHVAEAGIWDELAAASFVLDRLDPESVAAEALRTAYGKADLPLTIAASLSAQHMLSAITPEDRSMTRSVVMACLGSGESPFVRGDEGQRAWARLRRHDPLHVLLVGHRAAVRACTPLELSDGRTHWRPAETM